MGGGQQSSHLALVRATSVGFLGSCTAEPSAHSSERLAVVESLLGGCVCALGSQWHTSTRLTGWH
eukprot:14846543-Alexandrium_andersonii.AAC.1